MSRLLSSRKGEREICKAFSEIQHPKGLQVQKRPATPKVEEESDVHLSEGSGPGKITRSALTASS